MTRNNEGGRHRPDKAAQALASGLGWFSIGLGLAEVIAPKSLARTLGMEGKEGIIRAYGVREIMTGVAILASHDPTPWIWGRVGGDGLDLATLAPHLSGDNPKQGNAAVAAAAVAGVTALDVLCAQRLTAEKALSPPGTYDYSDRSGFPRAARSMRGAARDFEVPRDFRIPDALRPWTSSRPSPSGQGSTV
jgi:hypothetical protein